MNASNRIIINTLAQYVRTIVNLILSLYSARLVLSILGSEDYGIYALVAGVVSMLSFLTNSLVGSTQRFLSIYQGKGEQKKLKEVFVNSLLLHIFLGLIITLILEMIKPLLFNGFLNIPSNRVPIASIVFQQVIWMVYISFIASPYRALLVSRENIIYTSLIDILDGFLKVLLVLILPFIPYDKLQTYGCIMLIISLFNLFAFSIYTHDKYEECIFPHSKYFSLEYIKGLSSYTGWIMYSTVCIALRTQGLAVVFNKIFGPAINAAYGIGGQISGMISFVSASFNNAIAPQLMAAEGRTDRNHMWLLAKVESKFSFLLLAMIGIPTMFEMPALLKLWLVEVPPYTMLFGCMFLSMQIVDMLTTGLGLANRAIGNIGWYTLVTYTPKLLILPIGWSMLNHGMAVWMVCIVMVIVEIICMLMRIPLLRKEVGFKPSSYCREVLFKSMPPVFVGIVTCLLISYYITFPYRFILTFIISILLFAYSAYTWSLNDFERDKVVLLWHKFFSKIRK